MEITIQVHVPDVNAHGQGTAVGDETVPKQMRRLRGEFLERPTK
ncbi:hypothetical protein [Halogeometricum pallidum]|nr:hypothetical protein [Halogeometricum pallidum]